MKWLTIFLICFCSFALAGGRNISFDDLIFERIQRMWSPTSKISGNTSVEIEVNFERSGKIKSTRISRSSGDYVFDNSVIMAVMNVGMVPEIEKLDLKTYNNWYARRKMIITFEDLEVER